MPITVSGSKIDYTYDPDVPTQLNAVTSGGVTTRYTYDSRGNVTRSRTMNAENGTNNPTEEYPVMDSSATYTDSGEYMSSITDGRGYSTTYEYNEKRGYLKSETNPNNVKTSYTYQALTELLSGVSVSKDGSPVASVAYSYDTAKRLASIVSPSGTSYSFTYDGFGRTTSVKVGNTTLSQYTYNNKGLPATLTYGNGVVVRYGYDNLNRQTEFYVNDWLKYEYNYDGMSRLSELVDYSLHRKTKYEYDILGRPTSEKVIDVFTNSLLSKLSLRYDDTKNRIAGYDVSIGSTTNSTDYVYGGTGIAPDLITSVNLNGTRKISYIYDGLNRLSVRNLNNYFTEYTYLQGANTNSTTTLISEIKNGNDTLAYTYDELGNITSISENGTVIESYTYDDLNQLKTVTRGNDVYTYNYDNGGNILSVTKNGTSTKTYTYGNSQWKDLLTAFNGNAITYDNIGNPLNYYDGSTFSWSDGRKLTGITKGTDNISYAYDSNGLRASKNVNGTVTEYYWLDGTLYAEKTGNRYIYFHYDDNGIAYGFTVNDGTTTADYYYIHNLQGDVIGIVDNSGTKVVEYTYDEWGKLLATTGTLATTIGTLNPIRYRGYYYDTETGLYYVSSRYYDPEIGRWINADSYISTGNGVLEKNMFAYCLNNPVNMVDPSGEIAITTLILIGSIVAGVAVSGYTAYTSHKYTGKVDWNNTILSGLSTFAFCYTYGMSAYGMYVSYCDYKGYTPVTNIGSAPKTNPAPYSNLQDPSNVAPGKDFTASQKAQIIQQNKINNNGVVKSDLSGQTLVPPQKSMKGVTPPANEWQIDHIIPKSAGGTNSFSNAQVLSREENRIKWDH